MLAGEGRLVHDRRVPPKGGPARTRSDPVARTVFHVVDSLRLGGTERMAVDLSNGLVARGWDVHLIVTRETGPLAADLHPEVEVHLLERRSRWDLGGLRVFRQLVRRDRPAIVHAHGWSSLQFVTAGLIGRRRGPAVVLHDHGGARYRTHARLYRLVAWPLVAAHLAVGRSLLDPPLPTRLPAITEVVPNGIPVDRIRRKEHYDVADPPRLVVVGNLRAQKDHLGLIRAVALLRDRGVDVEVDLIGATPEPDLLRRCRALIAELDLADRVHPLGRQPEVGARLATYDLGLISSHTESGPIALIEYLAAGLPFVTTDVGEIPALLPASLRSWVVAPGDPGALADGVVRALAAPSDERARIGDVEAELASTLSIDRAVGSVGAVYGRLGVGGSGA